MEERREFKKNEKVMRVSKERRKKPAFVEPEIVEERDFRGVVAVTWVQTISNLLPKTFRV